MIVTHKIALKPNKEASTYFAKASGTARFAYNWALAEWQRQYEKDEKPSKYGINKKLNSLKKEEFPWMYEVTKAAPQIAVYELAMAFSRFFDKKLKAEYPKPKKKGKAKDSFRVDDGVGANKPNAVNIKGKKIKIPKLGWVKMVEPPRFSGNIKSAVISRTANRWFVSLAMDTNDIRPIKRENQAIGGVDLGIKSLATTNDGVFYENPKALNKNLKKLKRLQRSLSRRKKGSNSKERARRKVAKQHATIANIRKDALHKVTIDIIRNYAIIGIEDLNVQGMMQNHNLARAIADVGFYEFRRQLEYKAKWYGSEIVVVDKWYPSSKTCSECGFKLNKLALSQRAWICPKCKSKHDRDVNAAKNLANMALRQVLPEVTRMEIGVQTDQNVLAGRRNVNPKHSGVSP